MSPKYVGPAKWHGSRNNKPINRITIHATVGSEPGTKGAAENTVRYSQNTDRASSYHYVADALHSLQFVRDDTVAYHAPPNQHSLGYELCCSLTNSGKGHWSKPDHQKMLRIAAKDLAKLCIEHDIPVRKLGYIQLRAGQKGLAGHNDVRLAWHQTSHTDPGPYFPWKQFIILIRREVEMLVEPPAKSRGVTVEHAIDDLLKAAKRAEKQPVRLRKIKTAIDGLRTIQPK